MSRPCLTRHCPFSVSFLLLFLFLSEKLLACRRHARLIRHIRFIQIGGSSGGGCRHDTRIDGSVEDAMAHDDSSSTPEREGGREVENNA